MSDDRPTPITIKKYTNRRMYDATNSRYVNLVQIAALIKAGETVVVMDAASGEDLTKVILTQIILEEEKGQGNLLPVEFLHELIKYGETTSGDVLRSFLASGFEAYKQAQEQMASTIRTLIPPLWPGVPTAAPGRAEEEVDELKERLAKLEARLTAQAKTKE